MLTALSFNNQDTQTNNHYNYCPENEVMAMDNQRTLTPEQENDYNELKKEIKTILQKYPNARVFASEKVNKKTYKKDENVNVIITGINVRDIDEDRPDLELCFKSLLSNDCDRMIDSLCENRLGYAGKCDVIFVGKISNDQSNKFKYNGMHEIYKECNWL